VTSVKASLKKLQTSYIDIVCIYNLICVRVQVLTHQLYVHWWDYSTGVPELMQSLNNLVRDGTVLYLGISDAPAWVVR
jgi:aryl-alcohol dehydrogenase-like predicted oxidoreductase